MRDTDGVDSRDDVELRDLLLTCFVDARSLEVFLWEVYGSAFTQQLSSGRSHRDLAHHVVCMLSTGLDVERLFNSLAKRVPLRRRQIERVSRKWSERSRASGGGNCTILFLASNPASTSRLELDEEARLIEERTQLARHDRRLAFKALWATRADDMSRALNEFRPTIVHFSGHGVEGGRITLHDERGERMHVSLAALGRLLRATAEPIRLVVLNACYSNDRADALTDAVDCVISVSDAVADHAARRFSTSFYSALSYGNSIKLAFEQSLATLEIHNLHAGHFRLQSRPGLDPAQLVLCTRR